MLWPPSPPSPAALRVCADSTGSLNLVALAVGVVLGIGAARVLRGVLYGLGAIDVVSFATASVLFLTIALVASWLPSRRAMRIDPLVALREQ